jgi:cytoskeletal protein CcmA (bactofilin family)
MHPRSFPLALLLALVSMVLVATPVAAGDFRGADIVSVAQDETVDDDLYVAAGTVNISGTVAGDATVSGGTVTVAGRIEGSLNVAGGSVDVLGEVVGAVRVSGGTVRIGGSVGRDLVVFGGTATVASSATVAGDLAGGVGTLTVDGSVEGDLLVGAGSLTINGSVDGDVNVGVTDLTLGSTAVVGGDVTYTSRNEARIADGADVGGAVERQEPADAPGASPIADNPIVSFIGALVGMLLLGWTLLAIRPRLVLGSGETLRRSPLPALGIGVVGWIGQFVAIIVLVVVGALLAALAGAVGVAFIVFAIVVLMLLVIGVFVSAVPVAMAIGDLVMPGDRSPYLAYLIGAAILAALVVAGGYVPALGAVITILVWILGLGALLVYAWRTRHVPWPGPGSPVTAAEPAPAA